MRKFSTFCFALILMAFLLPTHIHAGQIVVSSTTDGDPGSLRSSITAAASGDTISFSVLLLVNVHELTMGELTIDKNLTILGDVLNPAIIDGGGVSRIFNLTAGNELRLSSLMLRNGIGAELGGAILMTNAALELTESTISGSRVTGTAADHGGGAIANNGGSLTINNSVLTGNSALGPVCSGGAILNLNGGNLSVTETSISGNTATRAGGGIEDNSGAETTVVLENVDLLNNTTGSVPGNGGGVHITGPGNMNIFGGRVSDNTAAAEGGGLWNGTGTMNITGVTIDNNTASGDLGNQGGGGVFNAGGTIVIDGQTLISNNKADGVSGSGGGILNDFGSSISITDAIISGNSASRAGGGLEDHSGILFDVNLTNVDFIDNSTAANPGNGGGIHVSGTGSVNYQGGTVSGNTAASEGGGLWNNSGTMTVDSVTIDNNTASGADADQGGGGVFNNGGELVITGTTVISNNKADGASGSGGGILIVEGSQLRVSGATISNNTSNRAGGGIEDASGAATTVSLEDVDLLDNSTGSSPGNGGGVHITGPGNMTITGGTVSGNMAAAEGGGLWNGSGTMSLSEVTVATNVVNGDGADQGGGGVFNAGGTINITASTINGNQSDGNGPGGGINNDNDGVLMITSSTISGNMAVTGSGGIHNAGVLTGAKLTVTDNTAGTMGGGVGQSTDLDSLHITSSIVAGNFAANGDDISGVGSFTSGGYNLIGLDDGGLFVSVGTDSVGSGMDTLFVSFAPLADNGGPTMTHALLCPNPAVNAGDPADQTPDQRGEVVFGNIRDIGAFELQQECATSIRELDRLLGSLVFPNPTGGNFVNVYLPARYGSGAHLRIISLGSGRVLRGYQINAGSNRIDTHALPNGLYAIELTTSSAIATHRLVISR